MKIAIDKNIDISKLKKGNDYVYVFDDNEKLNNLIKTNMHCLNKEIINNVDINMTKYDIKCIKKAKITDKDYDKVPPKKDYKFAIIVPNCNNNHGEYKGKTFLQNCIESILNQTYKNFELIFVDDMSSDTSVATTKEYMKKDKRIHLIENIRKRYNGGSRNVGIEYALENLDFDYFCFLDSDDWWIDNEVLKAINEELYDNELMIIGLRMLDKSGVFGERIQTFTDYKDFFLSENNLWCTAWSRVIRQDKIVYFCEDTLMEDRVWSYRQADNIELDNVKVLEKICYVWNRMNTNNSVSQVRGNYWDSSAWCHIGHQLQLLSQLKHEEYKPILEKRIQECIDLCNSGTYAQH